MLRPSLACVPRSVWGTRFFIPLVERRKALVRAELRAKCSLKYFCGMEKRELTLLGKKTDYRQDYAPEVLEAFTNRHPERDYRVHFDCPEFTSLCPITGQPDFATITIDYIPDVKMVESKSLKLYLFSFRTHGAFHEDCVNLIMKDLIRLMDPKYIEVRGIFTPRGGISIHPLCTYGRPGTRYEALAERRLFDSGPL